MNFERPLFQPIRRLVHVAPSEEQIYRELVLRRARKVDPGGWFSNDSLLNSAAVHEAMFVTASSRIRVVARGVKDEIFGDDNVLNAGIEFMKRDGVSLSFDIRTGLNSEAECAAWLRSNKFLSTIEARKSSSSNLKVSFYLPSDPLEPAGFLPDFGSATLGDHRMYRQRSSQKDGDYGKDGKSNVDFSDEDRVSQIDATADELLKAETLVAVVAT